MENDRGLGNTVVLGSQMNTFTLQLTARCLYTSYWPAMGWLAACFWPAIGLLLAVHYRLCIGRM